MWRPQRNTSGFSIVVAILVSAFLIMLSMGVLDLILGERRITRVVYNTVSGYAGAEGALEIALLKIKNHRDGFSDSIDLEGSSDMLHVLAKDQHSARRMEQKIAYEMITRTKENETYTGSGLANEFVVIPLYFDTERDVIRHDDSVTVRKTEGLRVSVSDQRAVWNIISNKGGDSVGLVGKGDIGPNAEGTQKELLSDPQNCDADDNCEINIIEHVPVANFLSAVGNVDSYLVLFSDQAFDYSITSSNGFALPKISVVATTQIGDFMQSINFTEDKSRLFDALKYSVFSE